MVPTKVGLRRVTVLILIPVSMSILGRSSCGMTASTGDGVRLEGMVSVSIVLAVALMTRFFIATVITA